VERDAECLCSSCQIISTRDDIEAGEAIQTEVAAGDESVRLRTLLEPRCFTAVIALSNEPPASTLEKNCGG
jgi:hypothetical protein